MDPQEIEKVEFKTTRLKEGYDADEVDNFLDRVAIEVRYLVEYKATASEELVSLRRQLATVQRQLDAYGDLPTQQIPMQAAGILEAAQRVADQVQAEARIQADTILAEADVNARAILDGVNKEADVVSLRLSQLRTKHQQLRDFLAAHITTGLEELEGNPNG